MATTIRKSGSITAKPTKYGAKSSKYLAYYSEWLKETKDLKFYNGGHAVIFVYGFDFDTLNSLSNPSITDMSIYVNSYANDADKGELKFRVVKDFKTSGTDTSIYTDFGDGSQEIWSGYNFPGSATHVTPLYHTISSDRIPNTLSYIKNNINDLINGKSTTSFGLRLYGYYASIYAGGLTVTVNYEYDVPAYTLTVTAGTGGTATGGGTYESGQTATITATPNNGYKFVKWSDGNTAPTRTITITSDAIYTATFEPDRIKKIYTGNGNTDVYLGTSQLKEVYIGTKKLYG